MILENTDSKTSKIQFNTDKALSFNPEKSDKFSKPVWFEKIIEKLSELGD